MSGVTNRQRSGLPQVLLELGFRSPGVFRGMRISKVCLLSFSTRRPQHEPRDLAWFHFHRYPRRRDNRAAVCFRGLAGDHRAGDGVYHEGRSLQPEHIQRQLRSSVVFTASYFFPSKSFSLLLGLELWTTVITSKTPAAKDG